MYEAEINFVAASFLNINFEYYVVKVFHRALDYIIKRQLIVKKCHLIIGAIITYFKKFKLHIIYITILLLNVDIEIFKQLLHPIIYKFLLVFSKKNYSFIKIM